MEIPSIEIQKMKATEVEKKIECATKHIVSEVFERPDPVPASWRNFGDPLYENPLSAEVSEVILNILDGGITKAALAGMIGVSSKNNRTLNALIKGASWPTYAQWRLLLIFSGKITVFRINN